jgi:hypothetical protein
VSQPNEGAVETSDQPGGFDARKASGHTAEILAIFAALVIPVLFEAASSEVNSAGSTSTGHLPLHWLAVAIVLLCAAFLGLAGASIGLLGLAGDQAPKPAQISSAMALYAQATCGFVALLAAVEVYCSTLRGVPAVGVVLVCVVASVGALGCMTVSALLVDSASSESGAWIKAEKKTKTEKKDAGTLHFTVITIIAVAVLLVVTLLRLPFRVSIPGMYPGIAAGVVIFFAVVFLPFSVFRSLPRTKRFLLGPIKPVEAYTFGLVPALATSLLILGLPL